MDAICFVLGMRTAQLRGADLRDLVYNGAGATGRAFVKLVLAKPDGEELEFMRSIANAQSEYRLDGTVVSAEVYLEKLEALNVLTKARNCVVFQGDVESIAAKTPKELTALIEQISGSDQLKDEYDQLAQELAAAEDTVVFVNKKIKGISAEKKQFKDQKVEADRFVELQTQQKELQRTEALMQLFYLQQDLVKLTQEKERKRKEMDKLRKQQADADALQDRVKADLARVQQQLQSKEREMRRWEEELATRRPEAIAAQEAVSHVKRRVEERQAQLTQLTAERTRRDAQIRQLEADLAEVARQEQQLDQDVAAQQRQFKDLTPAQWARVGPFA